MPDDLAYELTKTVWDNIDVLREAHPAFKIASLETALKGATAPPHRGALRYYLEHDVPGVEGWARLFDVPCDERRAPAAGPAQRIDLEPQFRGTPGPGRAHASD